jgi:carbon-monoxide dehydrogenase medium subunit
MKAVAFDYARPRTTAEATELLAQATDAKVIAGGQTLGPMLNLRLAQPDLLIDITRIPELAQVQDDGNSVVFGATVTHAAIEDHRTPDPTHGFLPRVAKGIAYRAVRTRGTVGGSLAHADPAADWLSTFTALGADIVIAHARDQRRVALADFMRAALDTDLGADELVAGVSVPKLSRAARCGYHKICRKTGEFAEAIGVVVYDPDNGVLRLVSGSTQGRPIVIEGARLGVTTLEAGLADRGEVAEALRAASMDDAYELKIHVVAIRRAIEEALAA